MTGTQDWKALAAEVRKRREKMRLPIDLADHGGPTEMTVRKIESGEAVSIRPRTKVLLEQALGWRQGLVDRILDGTATPAELDEVVVYSSVQANLPGVTAALRGQVIRPEGIPSGEQFGGPTVTLGDDGSVVLTRDAFDRRPLAGWPTAALVSELLARLVQEDKRSAGADDALRALSQLLPELFGPDDSA